MIVIISRVGFTSPKVTYKPRSSVDVTDLRSVDVLRSGFAASKRRSFPRISFADSEKMKSTDDESPSRYFIKSFSENLPTNYMYIIYMYNYLSIYGVKM